MKTGLVLFALFSRCFSFTSCLDPSPFEPLSLQFTPSSLFQSSTSLEITVTVENDRPTTVQIATYQFFYVKSTAETYGETGECAVSILGEDNATVTVQVVVKVEWPSGEYEFGIRLLDSGGEELVCASQMVKVEKNENKGSLLVAVGLLFFV